MSYVHGKDERLMGLSKGSSLRKWGSGCFGRPILTVRLVRNRGIEEQEENN